MGSELPPSAGGEESACTGGCEAGLRIPGDAGTPVGAGGEPVGCLTGPAEAGAGDADGCGVVLGEKVCETAGEPAGEALGDWGTAGEVDGFALEFEEGGDGFALPRLGHRPHVI